MAAAATAAAQSPRPAVDTTPATQKVTLPGLAAPAQILVDRWGVPHLYAASTDDLYFAQGYNAARDRLFQIDLWRRRGLGRLASVFGGNFVEQDRAARLFLYRGDMAREWAAYGSQAQRIATRFVAGINAYIDHIGRDEVTLPFEFTHFGYLPEKWQPEDVVRIRSHGLTRNLGSEFSRAYVACHSDLKSDQFRVRLQPPWQPHLPDKLDLCIPPDVMRAFTLATQGVLISGRDATLPGRRSALPADVGLAQVEAPPAAQGSNAWVVAPSRTASGRPLLASDPHRSQSAPSLRYIVHLNAPGISVIGGGEPALPGVSIGHNGAVAFGLTISAIDQEDLYVYETNPANPLEYRYQGRWEKMKTVQEPIPVLGRSDVPAELLYTRHGPVVLRDGPRNRAYAVRSGWFEPGTAPYFGSIDYMNAKDAAAFRRAMLRWGAPSENQLYADAKGQIGWVTGGLAPIRPNWDGLLPVPGDGRYEWAGFWSGDQLPSSINPAAGWIASSNEMNLLNGSPDYPWRERKLGFEWPSNTRYQRVAEVLAATPKMSVEDAMRLQNDVASVTARRLQAVLKTLPAELRARRDTKLLLDWNLQETGDSAATLLYELWWVRHLGAALNQAVLPRNAAQMIRTADAALLLETLERPAPLLGSGNEAVMRRNAIIEQSLQRAWSDAEKLAGADPAGWRWDKLHHITFPHPLANAADEATRAKLNVGPFPKQGGSDTVNLSSYEPESLRQVAGPSFRVVIDVGGWDNSVAMNTPGQSGDPASPHYRDLAPMWLKGEYFPLLYSRPKVEAATVQRIELLPANKPAK